MLKEMEMATGGQLYQEKPTGNSRDTIPIRPTTNSVLCPQNTRTTATFRKGANLMESNTTRGAYQCAPLVGPPLVSMLCISLYCATRRGEVCIAL